MALGLWDHWVPGANEVLEKICKEWGEANKVEVTVDFITSIGFKNILTAQAESRARKGHDMLAHPTWQISILIAGSLPLPERAAKPGWFRWAKSLLPR